MPGFQAGARLTTNSGVVLEHIGNCVTADSTTLTWTATYLIDDPTQVITFGQQGVTLSGDAGLLQDSLGNATLAFTNIEISNKSLVDISGFTTQNFNRGTGGVTIYVSSTYGDDSRSFTTAQNPATPYRTIATALSRLWSNGMDRKGADVRLLRGETFTSGSPIKTSGQDAAHPFIIEDYWYDYSGSSTDPGTRPVLAIDETNTTMSDVFDTTSGGGTPATVDNVVIRRLSLQAVNWTGNYASRYGFNLLRGGTNWTIDDCDIGNFGTNVVVQGYWSPFHDVTLLRTIVADARYDNAVVHAHSQGLFVQNTTGLLVSQCTFDNNGRVSADRTGRDLYSHNIYIKEDCGPAVVWGNVIRAGGSYGIEMRSGGVLAYNYLGRNALGAFVDGIGGTQYKNVVEKAEDISATDFPRGFGLQMTSTYGTSMAQTIEFNIIANSIGHQNQAITMDQTGINAIQNAYVSHNTIVNAGQIKFNSTSSTPAYISAVYGNNVIDSRADFLYSMPSFASWSFYNAGLNALNSTASRSRVVQIGNDGLTLPAWRTVSGGAETSSATVTPSYVNASADIGSYFQSIGGTNSETDYVNVIRHRLPGNWPQAVDTLAVLGYFSEAYKPTNLNSLGSGNFDYYGATDYRTVPATAARISITNPISSFQNTSFSLTSNASSTSSSTTSQGSGSLRAGGGKTHVPTQTNLGNFTRNRPNQTNGSNGTNSWGNDYDEF
jgi:hypothetical protein